MTRVFTDTFQSTSSIQRKTRNRTFLSFHLMYFNPLPLYRGRQNSPRANNAPNKFQSTSSIQRKTIARPVDNYQHNISIHFLYTEEDTYWNAWSVLRLISIHFLYTEEDLLPHTHWHRLSDFNPLPLYRGRLLESKNPI